VRKVLLAASVLTILTISVPSLNAQVNLLAIGSLTNSSAGPNADLSGLTNTLENGAPANLLGGFGSGITWASGNTFLAVPDRGPNAVGWASSIDDTASYIERFHTITMDLEPNSGAGLPFTLTPTLQSTTLFFSPSPLVYGPGGEVDNLGNTSVQVFRRRTILLGTTSPDVPTISILTRTPVTQKTRALTAKAFGSQTTDSSFTPQMNMVLT
jgi:hypothetical protein